MALLDKPMGMEAWDKKKVAMWLNISTELGMDERKALREVSGKKLLMFKPENFVNLLYITEEQANELYETIADYHKTLVGMYCFLLYVLTLQRKRVGKTERA